MLYNMTFNHFIPVINTTPRTTAAPSTTTTIPPNDHARLLQTLSASSNDSIGQMFPGLSPFSFVLYIIIICPHLEILNSYGSQNNITNQIIHLVVSRLNIIDFTHIFNGVYQPLNVLRIPLQNLLQRHQQECEGSRDQMLENVVMELEFFNRVYMSVFDRLRGPGPVEGLSDDARRNFNQTIDIPRTINNLNRV